LGRYLELSMVALVDLTVRHGCGSIKEETIRPVASWESKITAGQVRLWAKETKIHVLRASDREISNRLLYERKPREHLLFAQDFLGHQPNIDWSKATGRSLEKEVRGVPSNFFQPYGTSILLCFQRRFVNSNFKLKSATIRPSN
jgi:hypothetical protein